MDTVKLRNGVEMPIWVMEYIRFHHRNVNDV